MRRGNLPTGPLRQIVRMQSEPLTVYRRAEDIDSDGDGGVYRDDPKYKAAHTVSLAVDQQGMSTTVQPEGERTDGALTALGEPSVDLREGDRITYGELTYEVQTPPESIPTARNPVVKRFTLSAV